MPFNHDEFIRLVTDYYDFCSHSFWNVPIHYAPPGGWPSVTDDIIAKLDKNDVAAKLIRHLPYPEYNMDPNYVGDTPFVIEDTMLVDYRCENIQNWVRGDSGYGIDPEKTPSHCVVIAMSLGTSGYYVVVDTKEGHVYWGDINGEHDEPEQDLNEVLEEYVGDKDEEWRDGCNVYTPSDFFALCKKRFIEMRWIGLRPTEIKSLRMNEEWGSNEEHNQMVDAIKEAGWPGQGYNKEKFIAILNE